MLYLLILLIAILIAISFSYRRQVLRDNYTIPKRGGYTLFFDNSMANIIGLESCKGVIPMKINESKKGYYNFEAMYAQYFKQVNISSSNTIHIGLLFSQN